MAYTIKNNYTNVNYNSRGTNPSWIIIHNTANGTSAAGTAYNNTAYFKNAYRGASAHYFIDDDPETIWCCVKPTDTAWHCGDSWSRNGAYNYNAIGIEVCEPSNGVFTSTEIDKLTWLVQKLMKQYGIPASRVQRHYDVTTKTCPIYYASHNSAWESLRKQITGGKTSAEKIVYESKNVKTNHSYRAKETMNVRANHGTSYKKIGFLEKGSIVTFSIVHQNTTGTVWGKIASGGKIGGWVCIKSKPSKKVYMEKGAIIKVWSPLKVPTRKVSVSSLNIREKASSSSNSVGTLKKNSKITFDYAKRNFYGNIWGRIAEGKYKGKWVCMYSASDGWYVVK